MIQVFRKKTIFAVLMLSASIGSSQLQAQQPKSAMRIRIAQNSVQNFMADLEYIIKLNKGKNAEKQWENLDGLLNLFQVGINRNQPIRWDLILGDGQTRFRPSFPVNRKDLKKFRKQNLNPLGIKTVKRGRTVYVCKGDFVGFMNYQNGYATFVEQRADLNEVDLGNITGQIESLVDQYDLGMVAENNLIDEKSIEARRNWIKDNNKQILATFQKKDDESKENFELRKSMFGLQLEELERYYSEASKFEMGWNTDTLKNEGRGNLYLTAIPDSSLDKAIALLGQKHSHFANIPRNENSILSFRLNHPLDDVRKKHLQTIFQAFSDKVTSKIDTETERTTEQKEAGKKVIEKLHNLFAENAQAGIADAFVEVWTTPSKKQTALAGFRVADGKEFEELLKLLPKTRKGRSVEESIEKIDGFQVHRIVLGKDDHPTFLSVFDSSEIHIATSKEVIWVAAGENAVDALKKSIKASQEKTNEKSLGKEVVFKLYAKIKPWLELRSKQLGKKGNFNLRTVALAAFVGADDTLNMELRKKDKQMKGTMRVGKATLRFVGQMIADKAKEFLD